MNLNANLLNDIGGAERALVRLKIINLARYMKPQYKDKYSWHHELVAAKIDQFYRGEIKRLMIFMPPQHQKSDFASRLGPAYALGKNPNAKIILASYSASLAETFNRDCQKIIDTDEYQAIFPATTLQPLGVSGKWVRNAEHFDIVGHEGYLKTVGVGGSTTGKPADYFIIDDPVKDSVEAQSAQTQQRNWEWFNDVVYTRIHNDSGIMIIQTRWDSRDLSGMLLDSMDAGGEAWTVVCLPAIKETNENPEDPRKIGEALYPQMHNLEKLEIVRKRSLRTFQSLYQQNPKPVQVGGECYKMFDYDTCVGDWRYDPELALHITFDFNVNPYMSAGVWQIGRTVVGGVTFFKAQKIEEICLKSPKNTTKAVCEHVRHKYAEHGAGVYVYGDPNGMKEDTRSEKGHNDYLIIRQELACFKPVLRIVRKAPSVPVRVSFMNTLFAGGYDGLEISIDRRCIHTIDDYQYIKEESDGSKSKLKIRDPNTGIQAERYGHCCDHDEYFICAAFANKYALYQQGGRSVPIKVGKRRSNYLY